MENLKRQIAVTKENREFLARAFKVTSVMVWKALNYKSDTDLAKKIRKIAVERGGQEFYVVPVEMYEQTFGKDHGVDEVVETFHDNDGYMRQYLPNGAMIELSVKDGSGDVFFIGEKKQHYENVLVSDIAGIQEYAMSLC